MINSFVTFNQMGLPLVLPFYNSVMELMTVMMDMMRIPSTVMFGLVNSFAIVNEVQLLICTQMHT